MSYRNAKNAGFTLVEILIVVVILGILAAIVIPQFTNASEAAKASQLKAQLQTIRSQLELSQIEHQGVYPALAGSDEAGWKNLLTKTARLSGSDAGVYVAYDEDKHNGGPAGPYLQKPPVNAFFAGDNATTVGAAAGDTVAWVYDQSEGTIVANATSLNATQAENLGMDVAATGETDGDVYVKAAG